MNLRPNGPPESVSDGFHEAASLDEPSHGCAALAAVSPLAARTVLRACRAWNLLATATQARLLSRVSNGPEASAARAALSALMESMDWKAGCDAQKAALERLAEVASLPAWFSARVDDIGPH